MYHLFLFFLSLPEYETHIAMKKLFLFFIFSSLLLSSTMSQQSVSTITPNLKYSKPSKEELTFTSYPADTTATAVYLLHKGNTKFTYKDGFQLVTEYWIRIKVLKPQGVSYADVTIPYYAPADRDEGQTRTADVEGCSYNMENGECVKAPIKSDLISEERVSNLTKVLKFSLPAVKVGTVFEYQYKLYSDYFSDIDNWMMQEELPVVFNQYEITIPNVFIYNIELRGKDHIESKEKDASMHATESNEGIMTSNANEFAIRARQLTFTSRNLPAIRQDESYCWCPEDYKIQISFDLEGTQFPGQEYKAYSQKWEDVDKQLTRPEHEQFGKHLSLTNPFREDAKLLLTSDMSFEERVIAAFQLLKKELAWNGKYHLYSKEPEKVIKAGNGNNVDLNFIFISILKDFGLEAYPVVLSRRSTGVLPFNFPSLQKLNTFVVAILNIENQEYVYLDSSMDVPALNVLPPELSVNKARILTPTGTEEKKWVNLLDLIGNTTFMNIDATIQDDQIKGHRTTQLQGQQAIEYQKQEQQKREPFTHAPESVNKEKLVVNNLKSEISKNDYTQIKEEFDFIMQVDKVDGRLYINPMLFPQLSKNPFIQTERILPIEFAYPHKINLMCSLTLPEGYEIEELPQSQIVKTEREELHCRYFIQKQENKVMVNYIFNLKTHLFPSDEYKQLQELWTKVIEKNNALIVLKKI